MIPFQAEDIHEHELYDRCMPANTYVLLLRSVNVGGRNPVPKADFKKALEGLGFKHVIIYLNSGNAVFESSSKPSLAQIQHTLESTFGFPIPILLLSGKQMKDIAARIPEHWTNDSPRPDKSGQKSDVLFLFDEIDTPDVLHQIGYKKEIEHMIYTKGAVLANITRKNQTRGSLQKFIGTDIYKKVTIRNITTARKLAELVN